MVTKHILILSVAWLICLLTFHFVLHAVVFDFVMLLIGIIAGYRLMVAGNKTAASSSYKKY